VGQQVSYTATVAATSGTANPTGTVALLDGGADIPGCGLQPVDSSGRATCTVISGGPGAHSITASYNGSPTFNPSTANPLSQRVDKAATSTTVSASTMTDHTYTIRVAVSPTPPGAGDPGGTVAFRDGSNPIEGCSARPVSGGSASCSATVPAGAHTLVATYTGDANFDGSSGSTSVSTPPFDSTTTLSSSASPAVVGQSVTYTATMAGVATSGRPTSGTVAFFDHGTGIPGCGSQAVNGSSQALCTVTYTTPSAHSIAATFGGNFDFAPSSASPLSQTVNKAATSTTMLSSLVGGRTYAITAMVTAVPPGAGAPTGTVAFADGGTPIAGCTLKPVSSGSATCTATFSVATHSLTADYSGDAKFTASSGSLNLFVEKIDTTVTMTSSMNPSTAGQQVTFSARVTPSQGGGTPTGTVAFFDDGDPTTPDCSSQTLNSGVATCTVALPGGQTHQMTAFYSGDSSFNASDNSRKPLLQKVN
jgi:hypothetical protein